MVNYVSKLAQETTAFLDDWIETLAEPEVQMALRGRVHRVKLTILLNVKDAEYGGFHPCQRMVQIGCDSAHVKRLMELFEREPDPVIGEDTKKYYFHTAKGTLIECICALVDTDRVLAEAIA